MRAFQIDEGFFSPLARTSSALIPMAQAPKARVSLMGLSGCRCSLNVSVAIHRGGQTAPSATAQRLPLAFKLWPVWPGEGAERPMAHLTSLLAASSSAFLPCAPRRSCWRPETPLHDRTNSSSLSDERDSSCGCFAAVVDMGPRRSPEMTHLCSSKVVHFGRAI
jgi:hypothetical protein